MCTNRAACIFIPVTGGNCQLLCKTPDQRRCLFAALDFSDDPALPWTPYLIQNPCLKGQAVAERIIYKEVLIAILDTGDAEMYLSAGIQKFQSLFLQLFDPAYNARAMPAALTKDRRELPPELFGRVMTAGHKHHRFIFLDWHRAPDGHLFGKDVFSGEEISSQQTEPIHILPCPVQQQPSGLQGEQLCRVIRAANFCPFRALWCFQFPTGLAFAPAFPTVAQQCQVQHQGLVQIIALCLNKTDLAQPPGSYGRKSLSFWLCRGVIIAVHA